MQDGFSIDWRWGDGLGMIQVHYIYCMLYFKSDAAADLKGATSPWPGGWEPLL